MNNYYIGQILICIQNIPNFFIKDREYKIIDIRSYDKNIAVLIDERNSEHGVSKSNWGKFFIKKNFRKEKLEKILNCE